MRSPLLAGINVVFGVIAGVIATMFHKQLAGAFPLVLFSQGFSVEFGGWNWLVFWFWCFLVLFALVWASREALAAEDRKQEVDELTELIESVPPPDFLDLYNQVYVSAFDIERQSRERQGLEIDKEELAVDLRWILDGLISLAARWDYRTSSAQDVYRANVMLSMGDKSLWHPELEKYAFQCYGQDHWPAVKAQAKGALYVDSALATADQVDGAPDEAVAPLLLVYSSPEGSDICIGGAPRAFRDNRTIYVADTQELIDFFPAGLPAGSKDCAQDFYNNDDRAKSIISLPIPGKNGLTGVLNIYRNSPNIMGSKPRAENFCRLMGPFVVIMGRILDEYRDA